MKDIDPTILAVVLQVARQKQPSLTEVMPAQALADDLGVDSLDLAQLVAELEIQLGLDPFAAMVSVSDIRTIGDLCEAYRRCAASKQPAR